MMIFNPGITGKFTGYNIFYMGINIGAFICNFVAAILRNSFGWGYAFAAAGIGMLIGVVTFWVGQKHLQGVSDRGEDNSIADTGIHRKLVTQILIPAAICGYVSYQFFGGEQTAAFIFATIPVIAYFGVLLVRAPQHEKSPIGALLSIFTVVIVFWMIFHQNGSSLTYWAEENTRRETSGAMASIMRFFYFNQDATIGTSIQDPDAQGSYWRNVPLENRPAPGEQATLISTGNKLSGVMTGLWEKIPLEGIFWFNCGSALAATIVIAVLTPWIQRVMTEHENKIAAKT